MTTAREKRQRRRRRAEQAREPPVVMASPAPASRPRVPASRALLGVALRRFMEDRGLTLAAALAYYIVFSIAPLLIVALAVAGSVFGSDASRGEVFTTVRSLIGDEGGEAVESMVAAAARPESGGFWAATIGGISVIIGSTGAFAELQDSLNLIWRVRSRPRGTFWGIVRQRLIGFSLVLLVSTILLLSLVVTAGLSAADTLLEGHLVGGAWLWQCVSAVFSMSTTSLLFYGVFAVLPDVRLHWRDVSLAAISTAILFTLGNTLIGLYLGSTGGSAYGAAGSAAVILLWAYASSIILFFGAELSWATVTAAAATTGVPVRLSPGATWSSTPAVPSKPLHRR